MKALVTGGGGFLGGAIVRRLRDRGDDVRSFSRGDYPQLRDLGVETLRGDLRESDRILEAVDGCDIVFHAGARAGVWGPYSEYYETNLIGTQNVVEACRKKGVTGLVFTSSPSVAFAGHDQEGLDESTPYPDRFLAHYPKTKAMAEQFVLKENTEDLHTVALRPHLIWGPGDTQLIPRMVERAKAGKLRIVGDGRQKVDAVYIDNAAEAHLLAADRLGPGAACAGKAYYITNHDPWPIGELINSILRAAGVAPIHKHIPSAVAYTAGTLFEIMYKFLNKNDEPPLTRFIARQLATAHWYDNTAAIHDLDYHPNVTMNEGMKRLAESFGTSIS